MATVRPLPDTRDAQVAAECTRNRRAPLFGISIDRISLREAVEQVWDMLADSSGTCRYVVTPNVDHVVQLQTNEPLKNAYREASLVLADGWPLVAASRLVSEPLPERVAGSDLIPSLFATAARRGSLRTFLLGAGPGVAERAADAIHQQWPQVHVVGTHCPPLGFEHDSSQCETVLAAVAQAQPQLLVVGLGAPKQELWLHKYHRRLAANVAVAAGATIDFLAGEQTRAPRWVQRIYMEWLFRAASDPRRLALRYLRGAIQFPPIVLREWRHARRRQRAENCPSPTDDR